MALEIKAIGNQTNKIGDEIRLQVNVAGNSGAVQFKCEMLPDGLRIDSQTGVIWGTPSRADTFTVQVSASEGTSAAVKGQAFTWTITAADTVLVTDIADQQDLQGEDVYLALEANESDVLFRADGLPPGLKIDAYSGVISGAPTRAGVYSVSIYLRKRGTWTPWGSPQKTFQWQVQETVDVTEKWFKVETPDYENNGGRKRSYLRLGCADSAYEANFLHGGAPYALAGWSAYTDGARFVETKGNVYAINHGDELILTEGEVKKRSEGDRFEFKVGHDFEIGLGAKYESFVGMATEVFLGGKYEATLTPLPSMAMSAGLEIKYGLTGKYEANREWALTLCDSFSQEASKAIDLSVDPDDPGWENWFENWAPVVAAAGAAVAGLAGVVSAGLGTVTSLQDAGKGVTCGAQGLADLLYAAGSVNALTDLIRRKLKSPADKPNAKLHMDKDGIELRVGESVISMDKDSIVLSAKKIILATGYQPAAVLDANSLTVHKKEILASNSTVKAKAIEASGSIKGPLGDFNMVVAPNLQEVDHRIHLKRALDKRRRAMQIE